MAILMVILQLYTKESRKNFELVTTLDCGDSVPVDENTKYPVPVLVLSEVLPSNLPLICQNEDTIFVSHHITQDPEVWFTELEYLHIKFEDMDQLFQIINVLFTS